MAEPPRLRAIEGGGEPDAEPDLLEYPPIEDSFQYRLISDMVEACETAIEAGVGDLEPMIRSMAQGMRWRLREWENLQR